MNELENNQKLNNNHEKLVHIPKRLEEKQETLENNQVKLEKQFEEARNIQKKWETTTRISKTTRRI